MNKTSLSDSWTIYNSSSLVQTTVIWIPGWFGQYWANYSPVFPTEITIEYSTV
jgi:hypothetical protein